MQPVKGMRDFLPEEKQLRDWMAGQISWAFQQYGFLPWETPALEYMETLARKGAGESLRDEIYCFTDKGNREVGMRFDLTIPLARVMAQNPQLPKPFKRYEIGKVWRYENPQAGRFREFVQADADIVGAAGMEAEAECLAAAVAALQRLGFKAFDIRLNNRKILNGLVDRLGIQKKEVVFRVLDKVEKIGEAAARKELKEAGVSPAAITKVFAFLRKKGKPAAVLKAVRKGLAGTIAEEGAKELEGLLKLAEGYKFLPYVTLDLGLVRGLDYYTGPIFEIAAQSKTITSSIAGGGRYDKLIGLYAGRETPATGISLGFERIYEILKEEGRRGGPREARLLVAAVSDSVRPQAVEVAGQLRRAGGVVLTDLMGRNLRKQLEWAQAAKIPFVVVVGERELKAKSFTLRNMETGKETTGTLKELVQQLVGWKLAELSKKRGG